MNSEINKEIDKIFGGRTRRLKILIDEEEVLAASVIMDNPRDYNKLNEILAEIIRIKESPDCPDVEVLGKYSPPNII